MANWEPKLQIAYIPSHCKGDINHADVEHGFVTSVVKNGSVFCRFWLKQYGHTVCELRTKANSESCNPRDLVPYRLFADNIIEEVWNKYVIRD